MIVQLQKPVKHDLTFSYGPYVDDFENSVFIDTDEPVTAFEKMQERKKKETLKVYDWYRYIDLSEE
jgi:hypothetical protein